MMSYSPNIFGVKNKGKLNWRNI